MHRRPIAAVRPLRSPTAPRLGGLATTVRRAAGLLLVAGLAGGAGCGGGGVPMARIRSEAAVERGMDLFVANCVMCHGQRGDGKGLRWESLITPPTDFTDPAWNAEATPERLFVSIRTGVPGTAMPAWPVFSDDETWDLVACVLAFDGSPGPSVAAGGAR